MYYRLISIVSHIVIIGLIIYGINFQERKICTLDGLYYVIPAYVYIIIKDPANLISNDKSAYIFAICAFVCFILFSVGCNTGNGWYYIQY